MDKTNQDTADKKKDEHKPATAAAAPSGSTKTEKPPASQQTGRGASNNAKGATNSKNASNKPDPYTNITIGHYVLGKLRSSPHCTFNHLYESPNFKFLNFEIFLSLSIFKKFNSNDNLWIKLLYFVNFHFICNSSNVKFNGPNMNSKFYFSIR